MNRSHPFQPERMAVPPSPAEIIELVPVPRVQLVIVLRINAVADPVGSAAAAVSFVSKVLNADRRLRLTVETGHTAGELQFVFRPFKPSAGFHDRLTKVAVRVETLVSQFDGAELVRADVVPQA